MTTILGINGDTASQPRKGSHDSGACLISDRNVLAAANEERFSRTKQDASYPFRSIEYVLNEGGATPEIAALTWLPPRQQRPMLDRLYRHLWEASRSYPPLRTFYWKQQWPRWARLLRPRSRTLPDYLAGLPIQIVEHHFAHAASAYFCSPFADQRTLVITLDGQGDFAAGSVWIGEKGRLDCIEYYDALNSIGHIYAAFTGFLGFTPNRHEGKIVGLAAYGNPEPLLGRLLDNTRLGNWDRLLSPELIHLGLRPSSQAGEAICKRLCEGLSREDISAGLQSWAETVATSLVSELCRKHDCRMVAAAGGVFANVKLNQRLLELEEVDNIYIHPNMGDGGLGVGAALAVQSLNGQSMQPQLMKSCYLGPDIGDPEAGGALKEAGLCYRQADNLPEAVAGLLADGRVVARAAGRMEYGPRALGNRSILAGCGDPSINQWLNDRLQRTEFMPFAPIIMEEYAKDYFPAWKPEHVAARFMTITYDASELAKKNIPAAIHVDGTARPQVLRRGDNPDMYAILEAYHQKTGIPALINTSFNMHEEPIVCSARDAVRAFQLGHLDALICGPYLTISGEQA